MILNKQKTKNKYFNFGYAWKWIYPFFGVARLLELLLRLKTDVINSAYIENWKINLIFIPSSKGITTEVLDLNGNISLFPKDVKR